MYLGEEGLLKKKKYLVLYSYSAFHTSVSFSDLTKMFLRPNYLNHIFPWHQLLYWLIFYRKHCSSRYFNIYLFFNDICLYHLSGCSKTNFEPATITQPHSLDVKHWTLSDLIWRLLAPHWPKAWKSTLVGFELQTFWFRVDKLPIAPLSQN